MEGGSETHLEAEIKHRKGEQDTDSEANAPDYIEAVHICGAGGVSIVGCGQDDEEDGYC